MNFEKLMAIKTDDGRNNEILGKYLYYSFPKLIIDREQLKEICTQLNFPIAVREKTSIVDAFRSATGDIHDRIVEKDNGAVNIYRIYCRDNKRVDADTISRELIEETLDGNTNQYCKLANIYLDKTTELVHVSDVNYYSGRDVHKYCDKAKELFLLYQDCISNRQIETIAEKYVDSMGSIKISARGHHFFVPKNQMHKVELLEDFMEELNRTNLYKPIEKTYYNSISINSMYVADEEKQRQKMATEFYIDIGKQIRDYQEKIDHLIRSGSESQVILNRWLLKVQSLEQKKYDYENILKQNLYGMDEEFDLLKTLCSEYKIRVNGAHLSKSA